MCQSILIRGPAALAIAGAVLFVLSGGRVPALLLVLPAVILVAAAARALGWARPVRWPLPEAVPAPEPLRPWGPGEDAREETAVPRRAAGGGAP